MGESGSGSGLGVGVGVGVGVWDVGVTGVPAHGDQVNFYKQN